jgi:CarD family transcriptional regulator
MFVVDDYIIYGNHGVCKVESVGTVFLPMVDKNKIYYTLRPIYKNEAVVYAPVDNPQSVIRPVLTRQEADKMIEEIPQLESVWIPNEKEREVQYKAALKTCDCRELIRIIKTLYERKMNRIRDGKKVTVVDERYFKQAEEQLYGELAFVMNMDRNQMGDYLVERISKLNN